MSTITTLNGPDNIGASRATINTNFANLNTDKLEDDTTATLTNKTFDAAGTGNVLSNVAVSHLAASAVTGNATKLLTTAAAGTNGNLVSWDANGNAADSSVAVSALVTTSDKTGADASVVSGTAGTSGNLPQWNVDGDLVDGSIAISDLVVSSDIANMLTTSDKTGADAGIVSGTAGTAGNLAQWNADGDAVDSSIVAANVVVDADIGVSVQAYDADTAKTDVAQEYTKAQNFNETTLTDGANIAWNLDDNQVATVTLAGNRTLDNPTNMKAGGVYILRPVQDATGSRTLAYGSAYKWPGGTAPTLTTTANAVDILTFISDGTNMYGVSQLDFS